MNTSHCEHRELGKAGFAVFSPNRAVVSHYRSWGFGLEVGGTFFPPVCFPGGCVSLGVGDVNGVSAAPDRRGELGFDFADDGLLQLAGEESGIAHEGFADRGRKVFGLEIRDRLLVVDGGWRDVYKSL
ncbi:hypothetical protein QPK87_27710 [Kamptonema cortianum]|nr:hypothetical protein [Kamptonema cortianum]MDL5053697.1 hypothetical protein [Oscillatoria laete-virens NRMC-F 0139]